MELADYRIRTLLLSHLLHYSVTPGLIGKTGVPLVRQVQSLRGQTEHGFLKATNYSYSNILDNI